MPCCGLLEAGEGRSNATPTTLAWCEVNSAMNASRGATTILVGVSGVQDYVSLSLSLRVSVCVCVFVMNSWNNYPMNEQFA